MKRPLAAIGLIYLATSAVAVCLFPEVNFLLSLMAAVTAIAACFIFREKKRNILLALCPICIALLVIGCCQHSANELTDTLGEQSCVISGEICEIPRRQYGRWRYIIETDRIDIPGAKQHIRILVTSRTSIEEAREGDKLTCEVQFLKSGSETGYNSTTSLRADGVNARAWCLPYGEHTLVEGNAGFRYIPMKTKRAVTSAIRKALPEHASAMLCGMLLGDSGYMNSETIEDFRSTGIAHLLAVSGLHLTLLTLALEEILRRLKRQRRTSSIVIICFILSFMAVTGFPPSVVRAGVMHIIAQLGKIFLRDVDSLTSMSVAILLMCFLNPWAAADIGLQLSVCSTLGLLLTARSVDKALINHTKKLLNRLRMMPANRRFRKAGKLLLHSLAVSVTAGLSTLPLTAIHFGRVPLISPLTNLLCVYPASVFILLGIAASALYCVPVIGWIISLPLRFAAAVICVYLETVTGGLAGLPFSSLNTSFAYTPYLILFILLLIGSGILFSRICRHPAFSARLRRVVICEIAVLVFAGTLSHEIFCTGPEIVVFDAGGGVCVCAKNRTHAIFAEAGGDAYTVSVIKETLRARGVRKVDALLLSDEAKERSANLNRLLDLYAPDYLLTDADCQIKTDTPLHPFAGGIKVKSPDLVAETITDSGGKNWQRLKCGETVMLVCPEKGDCALLPESWRSCDAAVVGKEISGISVMHIGAVIITAKEKSADALSRRLQNLGIRHIYAVSFCGDVTLSVKNGNLRIRADG